MKTQNRLSHHDYHKACCVLEAEAELVRSLSIQGIITLISDRLDGLAVTTPQVRYMLKLCGIDRNTNEEESLAAVHAICKRLNWSFPQLVKEGKDLLAEAEKERLAVSEKSPPLPLKEQ